MGLQRLQSSVLPSFTTHASQAEIVFQAFCEAMGLEQGTSPNDSTPAVVTAGACG